MDPIPAAPSPEEIGHSGGDSTRVEQDLSALTYGDDLVMPLQAT
jgi:hypothetical protein